MTPLTQPTRDLLAQFRSTTPAGATFAQSVLFMLDSAELNIKAAGAFDPSFECAEIGLWRGPVHWAHAGLLALIAETEPLQGVAARAPT